MPELVVHDTFVLERAYPTAPERVFAAFADTARKRLWFAESSGHDVESFEMDFRIGGAEQARYRFKPDGPFPGVSMSSDGIYLEITPDRRIVLAHSMAMDGRIFSASLVTIELLPTATGTDLICTHQGAFFEGADGPAMRKEGWRLLLEQLAGAVAF
jgi:uncharacterized protein YndB with AHSA1/START domain